jgi:hypothetical protein
VIVRAKFLRRAELIGSFGIAVAVLSTRLACATCGEDCDSEYASATDD